MKRVRKEDDGSLTEFKPGYAGGPYRVEITVGSDSDLRALKKDEKLIAIRMNGTPLRGRRQYNLVPWQAIEDFDWL